MKKTKKPSFVSYRAVKDGMGWSLVEITVENGEVKNEKEVFSDVFDIFRTRAVRFLLGDI